MLYLYAIMKFRKYVLHSLHRGFYMSTKKKNKSQSSWILPGLFTILTSITTIYCLLQYRSSVPVVGISTLLLLASAYWLFLTITRIIKSKETPSPSVGEEQRERMNYEGMKLQGEELIRLVNMLGKGTYVNTKRTAERLELLLEQYAQLQKSNELLIQRLMDEQTKVAKFQVKYAQNDTGKLIAALNQQCDNLDASISTCSAAIGRISIPATAAPAPVMTQTIDTQQITDSLNELSSELANINASIQDLRQSLASAGMQASVQPTVQPVAEEEAEESLMDTPVAEEVVNEEGAPIEEDILPETATAEALDSEASAESATSASPDVSSLLSDDPNKQLSADEIAALFAALG